MSLVATVVGTRPEFIRAAVVSREIRRVARGRITELIVNTGQHYDYELSRVFFDQLGMPPPDFDLGVGSSDQMSQVAEMVAKLDDFMIQLKPKLVVVHGDTNSTLAGAIAARCHGIPIAHVEAGLRSGDVEMVEEQNRIMVDHLASINYCPTVHAVENLKREGLSFGVKLIGDLSFDAHVSFAGAIETSLLNGDLKLPALPDRFFLATIHRAENTDRRERLKEILAGLSGTGVPCVFPMHPRTRAAVAAHRLTLGPDVTVIEPVGFLEMLYLESRCQFVLTDSGSVQKEAYFFRKPCVTVRNSTEWMETVESRWNHLVPASAEAIRAAIRGIARPHAHPKFYGTGYAAFELVRDLIAFQGGP